MMLNQLKIGTRLGFGFGFLMVLTACLGYVAVVQLKTLSNLTDQMYRHPFAVTRSALRIEAGIIAMHRSMKDVAMAREATRREAAVIRVNELEKSVFDQFTIIEERFLGDKQQVRDARERFAGWKTIRDEVIMLTRQGQGEQAGAITQGRGAEYVVELERTIDKFIDFAGNKADSFLANAGEARDAALFLVYLLFILFIVAGGVIAWLLTRSITVPLKQAVAVAGTMAEGNFSHLLQLNQNDELGELGRALNNTAKGLGGMITELISGIQVLSGSISQISSTVTELATVSAQTMSSVSEITATVEEVKQTAHIASQKADQVSRRAEGTAQISYEGRRTTEDSITGMNRIKDEMEAIAEGIVNLSEQTQNIGAIIDSVNDLADQSNILSVNASIEAAKAGEHGKGFAVVAQEVKSLADQSKEATRRVSTILNDIQRATGASVMATERGNKVVEAGVDLSVRAGENIAKLAKSVEASAEAGTQIAASSQQQLVGMDQLAEAMENIKDASRQNLDGAKQLENATQDLETLSRDLRKLSTRFKVNHE